MSRFFAKPGDSSSEEESVASSSESESESSEDEKPQAKKKVVAEEPKVKKGKPRIVSQSCLPLSACVLLIYLHVKVRKDINPVYLNLYALYTHDFKYLD